MRLASGPLCTIGVLKSASSSLCVYVRLPRVRVVTGHADGWFFQNPRRTGHGRFGIVVVVVVEELLVVVDVVGAVLDVVLDVLVVVVGRVVVVVDEVVVVVGRVVL